MPLGPALKSRYARPVLHGLCLLPFVVLVWAAFDNGLGANPVERLTRETGEWTLRMLLITLAISPLRQWSRVAAVMRFRRMLGLYSFFYLCCHFLIWFIADHTADLVTMFEDIVERPYITLGFSAFLLMIPLAVTSNQWSIRRLGRRWRSLHQLVYLVILLGVLHYLWQIKADYREATVYAAIAILLLLHRIGPISRLTLPTARATR